MLTVPSVLTIEPTSYTPGSSPQPPNLSLGTGTITAGPDRVWDLVRPVTLDGAQAYRDPSTGQVAVQTSIGALLVQTAETTIPFGVPLTIRLTPGDPPLVTFMPPQGNAAPQGGAAQQGPVDTTEAPAVVLSNAAGGAETLMPGQIVVLTVMAGQPDQPTASPTSSTTIPAAQAVPAGQLAATPPATAPQAPVATPAQAVSAASATATTAALIAIETEAILSIPILADSSQPALPPVAATTGAVPRDLPASAASSPGPSDTATVAIGEAVSPPADAPRLAAAATLADARAIQAYLAASPTAAPSPAGPTTARVAAAVAPVDARAIQLYLAASPTAAPGPAGPAAAGIAAAATPVDARAIQLYLAASPPATLGPAGPATAGISATAPRPTVGALPAPLAFETIVDDIAEIPPSAGSVPVPAEFQASSDLAGLPSALAAQFPAENAPSSGMPPAAGLGEAADDDASFSGRILAVVSPGVSLPATPPGAIVAVVEGSTLAGQPILRTDDQSLVVESPARIAPGTTLVIQPVEPGSARPVPAPAALDPIVGRDWPALTAALSALSDSHTALAETMRLAIPQAGPLLGPVLLLFAASLRRGDARGWLGDAPLNELRNAGHGDLASMLSSDFEHASRQSALSLDDGWHTLPIPVFAEGALSRIQLHLRRYKASDGQDGNGSRDADGGSVRFVVEAEPSATGPVQLDGLVRRPLDAAPPALDLIVRSQMPLAPEIRSDILGLFTNSLAVTGLRGALVFQGGMNWVKVARDRASAASVMA